jgi:hypothetical protein
MIWQGDSQELQNGWATKWNGKDESTWHCLGGKFMKRGCTEKNTLVMCISSWGENSNGETFRSIHLAKKNLTNTQQMSIAVREPGAATQVSRA